MYSYQSIDIMLSKRNGYRVGLGKKCLIRRPLEQVGILIVAMEGTLWPQGIGVGWSSIKYREYFITLEKILLKF